jgi:hypothetical protein
MKFLKAGWGYSVNMQCNIDARGRRARLTGGIVSCALALSAAIGAAVMPAFRVGLAIAAVVLVVVGAFQIFEGVKGWCALRAMGIRTRV